MPRSATPGANNLKFFPPDDALAGERLHLRGLLAHYLSTTLPQFFNLHLRLRAPRYNLLAYFRNPRIQESKNPLNP